MGKHKKLGLFAVKCPNCGSRNTKVDWLKVDNYRRIVLTSVVALFGFYRGGYERVCAECGHKFAP
jgi:hypothetical protein